MQKLVKDIKDHLNDFNPETPVVFETLDFGFGGYKMMAFEPSDITAVLVHKVFPKRSPELPSDVHDESEYYPCGKNSIKGCDVCDDYSVTYGVEKEPVLVVKFDIN